ncbi:MAG: SDR family oxidoreductase [Chloroflexaceae bacterium]|nr:SDR family oxidoreductase [Chloroflexaceae bacterium]
MTGYVVLAGASRGTGREIARLLRDRQQPVKALLRSEAARAELEGLGIKVAIADALEREAITRAMAADPVRAVISTIGGLPQDGGSRADYVGNKHLIDGAVAVGASRFILVSSIGSGESAAALPPPVLSALGAVLQEKEQAEQYLRNSGLNYTIIRPGGLKSEPATGNGVLTENPRVSGSIHRADVAALVCDCLFSEAATGKILSAIDRQQASGETSFEILRL